MVGSSLTFNQQRAVNSLRCAVVSFGDNFWNLLASVYYLFKQFESEAWVSEQINSVYPYICTCNEDANNFAKFFGGTSSTAVIMGSCSEQA